MSGAGPVVCLTGAGISAESGLRTFRADDGLWEDHPVTQVATPEGFAADPKLVHRFYNERRKGCQEAEPNAAHLALAAFERRWPGRFLVVTQNIDDLHERAGSENVAHMHGEVLKARCMSCGQVVESPPETDPDTPCGSCEGGRLRPHIVWFGEMPLGLDAIYAALRECSVFIAVGTSAVVYPAAGFVQEAKAHGARCLEVNLEDTAATWVFDETRTGPATEALPPLLDELAAGAA